MDASNCVENPMVARATMARLPLGVSCRPRKKMRRETVFFTEIYGDFGDYWQDGTCICQ